MRARTRFAIPAILALLLSAVTATAAHAGITSNEISYGCDESCIPLAIRSDGDRHHVRPPGDRHTSASEPKLSISERRQVDDDSPILTAKPASDRSDSSGGGSSPILPILIAVAAVGVLSAGVAFFNERFRSRRRG